MTEFLSAEATKHYESCYRDEAYKLHRELHPEGPLSNEAFFSSKGSTLLLASGDPSPSEAMISTPRILKPTRFTARAGKRMLQGLTRQYIVDSGASFHLVSEELLTPKEQASKVELAEPVEVQTANGDVVISHKCRVYVDLWIWAYLLECTVAVLSFGALCSENSYTYMWKHGQTPALIKGNLEVKCQPRNNVPFIFTVEGNLNPALSDEDAMIEDILDEVDHLLPLKRLGPSPETKKKGRSRG